MLDTKNIGIIVFGGHVQSYGIVRIFGENKIPSIVVDNTKQNIARHSKYCIEFFNVDYSNLIRKLIEIGITSKYKNWLLFPTDDYYVRLLSQNKKLLDEYYVVTVDEWETINLFFNKRNSYPLVQKAGVPIPKTFYPNNVDELPFDKIDYPCIIKPAIMLDFYRYFKKKVFVCNNKQELKEYFIKATEIIKPNETLVQEIIPGGSEHQYSVGAFFDRDKMYNHLIGRRKRQHPIDFGNATTYAETVDKPLLLDYANKVLAASKFFGICEVEFKYDYRDEKYKFLEVNPRTWKWHSIAEQAEVPFLISIYNYFVNSSPVLTGKYKDAFWRDIVTDLPVLFQLLLKKDLILTKTGNPVREAVFNLNDILPFLKQLIYLPMNLFRR